MTKFFLRVPLEITKIAQKISCVFLSGFFVCSSPSTGPCSFGSRRYTKSDIRFRVADPHLPQNWQNPDIMMPVVHKNGDVLFLERCWCYIKSELLFGLPTIYSKTEKNGFYNARCTQNRRCSIFRTSGGAPKNLSSNSNSSPPIYLTPRKNRVYSAYHYKKLLDLINGPFLKHSLINGPFLHSLINGP